MRRGDIRNIKVDGQDRQAEYLGKGHYATAWRSDDRVYLFIDQDKPCYMKHALAEFVEEGTPHLPQVTHHEDTAARGKEYYVFSMPYYAPVTASDSEAWADYRLLQKELEDARVKVMEPHRNGGYGCDRFGTPRLAVFGHEVNFALADRLEEIGRDDLARAVRELAEAIGNYGSGCTFEFATRNLGVDASGALILRDVCFDSEKTELECAQACERAKRRAW